MQDGREAAAGDFGAWMAGMKAALHGESDANVPCDGCTACCTSSQFIHVAPDETDTLAHVPPELLFPAPGLPRGHVLLGYDEQGHCPMFKDGACSIYEHRPRTCRTYDCRVFTAAGLEPESDDAVLIARQVGRWRFSFPDERDRQAYRALRAAVAFLQRNRGLLLDERVPNRSAELAVLAVAIAEAFLTRDEETGEATVVEPDLEAILDHLVAW